MRIYVNEKKVQFRKRVAQIASFIGIVVLIIGMVITLRIRPTNPQYTLWLGIALGALIIGFIAAQIGNYNLRHFAKRPRMDEVLDRSLKGFDDKYEMYHWLLPAEHVLLGPAGVFVFVLRDTKAPVKAVGARWKQPFSITRALGLFGQEGLGDPVGEALAQAERLQTWIHQALPDEDIEVEPIVFFTEMVQITKEAPVVPPLLPKDIKKYLRTRQKESRLSDRVRKALSDLFHKEAKKRSG